MALFGGYVADRFLPALLQHLQDNREFPKYQYERRLDAFISFFLPDVLRARFHLDTSVPVRIPEFPTRPTRRGWFLSENIDYFLFDPNAGTLWLVELKTDEGSVRPKQLAYYNRVLSSSWADIGADVTDLHFASKHKKKYQRVLDQLAQCGEPKSRHAVFLAPAAARPSFERAMDRVLLEAVDPFYYRTAWSFLSLAEFARTNIETDYPAAWTALTEHIFAVFGE